MMAVDMVPSTGTPRELFRGDFGTGTSTSYDVAPDGRFLLIAPSEIPAAEHTAVRLVLNWLEELKRLVPREN